MKKLTLAGFVIVMSTAAWAVGTLTKEETSGQNKYCTYSDGHIKTIHSYEVCPQIHN